MFKNDSEDIKKENEKWTKILVKIRGDRFSQKEDKYREFVNDTVVLQSRTERGKVVDKVSVQIQAQKPRGRRKEKRCKSTGSNFSQTKITRDRTTQIW